VEFDACYAERAIIDIEEIPVPVISLRRLRQNKQAAGRRARIWRISITSPSDVTNASPLLAYSSLWLCLPGTSLTKAAQNILQSKWFQCQGAASGSASKGWAV
jgi:hypothetical protein